MPEHIVGTIASRDDEISVTLKPPEAAALAAIAGIGLRASEALQRLDRPATAEHALAELSSARGALTLRRREAAALAAVARHGLVLAGAFPQLAAAVDDIPAAQVGLEKLRGAMLPPPDKRASLARNEPCRSAQGAQRRSTPTRDYVRPKPEISAPKGSRAALPATTLQGTRDLWFDAIDVLSDLAQTDRRAEAQDMVDAVEAEWLRRQMRLSEGRDCLRLPSTAAFDGEGSIETGGRATIGLLSFLGYRVGCTSELATPFRHELLSRVFEGVIPPIYPTQYLADWGSPSTGARLSKMAESIAAFIRSAKRRGSNSLDEKISEWETDLQLLYEIYCVRRFRFVWPSTSPGTAH